MLDHEHCVRCGCFMPLPRHSYWCANCTPACVVCGGTQPSRRRSSLFCSDDCARQWKRKGELPRGRPIPQPTNDEVARFNRKVDASGACWVWTGAHGRNGYGQAVVQGHTYKAHRVAWTIAHGPIPEGLCVCHACDNRRCVRPDHLWLGTHQENQEDKIRKGRQKQHKHDAV